jgi:RecA DNA recombination protein
LRFILELDGGEIENTMSRHSTIPLPVATTPEGEPSPPGRAFQLLRAALPAPLSGRIGSARELARAGREEEREPLPTALPALDLLLAGGLPRGQLVELVGGRSSGRFSAVLTLLAAATGVGEAAGLVDLGDHLDPATAAGMGVDLARLLWLRPRNLKQALAGAEMLLGSGFPLVVVELGFPPLAGGRGAEAAWLRLARAARAQGAALLVASPYRVSGTAAAAVLKAGKIGVRWQGSGAAPRLLDGLSSQLALEKRRGAIPGQVEPFALTASPLRAPAQKPAPPAAARESAEPEERWGPIRLAAVG